ncbi:unnamed protein product [[Actinomadura] parvosata subsp. kistnae]|uniref:Uncharacterized protein n=1 Tax=[Actinomadura] parvosata subsp. kistnae TaxID=1909395 RepID=A0A1V0A347_9ACTN|nr:hypothetical protein [Nonomuraea sp. ATCC 55076]AQZ64641.1 hypothetical protein BKM31_27100 [Nonomuraea sp. ATCC 55076]SPL99519.1 unnamed protein product [Actinomadura parvosata subsp. kistnae]
MTIDPGLLGGAFVAVFVTLFVSFVIMFVVKAVQSWRIRRVLKYTDVLRATDLIGRVRQLKVRGHEEAAVRLVQDELAMPPRTARSWVRSV